MCMFVKQNTPSNPVGYSPKNLFESPGASGSCTKFSDPESKIPGLVSQNHRPKAIWGP